MPGQTRQEAERRALLTNASNKEYTIRIMDKHQRREAICEGCQKPFLSGHQGQGKWERFCSRPCWYEHGRPLQKGPLAPAWKGGGPRVNEHRLIAERLLGRPLGAKEVVHHINHNHTDNRPENLLVFASSGDHTRLHLKGQSPSPAARSARIEAYRRDPSCLYKRWETRRAKYGPSGHRSKAT